MNTLLSLSAPYTVNMAKINVDSLVQALGNDRVLEALGKIFQTSLDEALKKLDTLSHAFESLQQDLKRRSDQVDHLTKQNADLKTQVHNQTLHIEQLEAYNRQENLIVQGLPVGYAQAVSGASAVNEEEVAEHSADTEVKFLKLCEKQLGLAIQPSDISICHRLPKSQKQRFPPVIVRFTNRKARTAVLQARKKLRGVDSNAPPVYINEHLTRSAATLFANARKLVKDSKLNRVWTKNGRVLVKTLDGQASYINDQAELDCY